MNRLKCFKIYWYDAWHCFDNGIASLLVIGENIQKIDFLVNMKKYTIDISLIEDEFIEKMEQTKIQELNGYSYHDYGVLDGYIWEVCIFYDDIEIRSNGTNAYPSQFLRLMKYLHEEMELPVAECEKIPISKSDNLNVTINSDLSY